MQAAIHDDAFTALLRELKLAHQTATYYAEHETDPGKKLAWMQQAKSQAAAIAKAEAK